MAVTQWGKKIVYVTMHDRFLVDRVAGLERELAKLGVRVANVGDEVRLHSQFNDDADDAYVELEARVADLELNKAAGSDLADFAVSVCRAGEEQAHSIAHLEARGAGLEASAAELDKDCGSDWWRGLRQMGDQIRARALEERESRVVRLGISAALGQTGLSIERRVADRREVPENHGGRRDYLVRRKADR